MENVNNPSTEKKVNEHPVVKFAKAVNTGLGFCANYAMNGLGVPRVITSVVTNVAFKPVGLALNYTDNVQDGYTGFSLFWRTGLETLIPIKSIAEISKKIVESETFESFKKQEDLRAYQYHTDPNNTDDIPYYTTARLFEWFASYVNPPKKNVEIKEIKPNQEPSQPMHSSQLPQKPATNYNLVNLSYKIDQNNPFQDNKKSSFTTHSVNNKKHSQKSVKTSSANLKEADYWTKFLNEEPFLPKKSVKTAKEFLDEHGIEVTSLSTENLHSLHQGIQRHNQVVDRCQHLENQVRWQAEFNSAKNFFNMIGQLGGNSKDLQRVAQIGGSVVGVLETLNAVSSTIPAIGSLFAAGGALSSVFGAISMVQPYLAVGMAVFQLGSALFGSNKKESNQLAECLQQIMQQIETVRREMHQRFDRLEKILEKRFDHLEKLINHSTDRIIMSVDYAYFRLKALIEFSTHSVLINQLFTQKEIQRSIEQSRELLVDLIQEVKLQDFQLRITHINRHLEGREEVESKKEKLPKLLYELEKQDLLKTLMSSTSNGSFYYENIKDEVFDTKKHEKIKNMLGYLQSFVIDELKIKIDKMVLPDPELFLYGLEAAIAGHRHCRDVYGLALPHDENDMKQLAKVTEDVIGFVAQLTNNKTHIYEAIKNKYTNSVNSLKQKMITHIAHALQNSSEFFSFKDCLLNGWVEVSELIKNKLVEDKPEHLETPFLPLAIGLGLQLCILPKIKITRTNETLPGGASVEYSGGNTYEYYPLFSASFNITFDPLLKMPFDFKMTRDIERILLTHGNNWVNWVVSRMATSIPGMGRQVPWEERPAELLKLARNLQIDYLGQAAKCLIAYNQKKTEELVESEVKKSSTKIDNNGIKKICDHKEKLFNWAKMRPSTKDDKGLFITQLAEFILEEIIIHSRKAQYFGENFSKNTLYQHLTGIYNLAYENMKVDQNVNSDLRSMVVLSTALQSCLGLLGFPREYPEILVPLLMPTELAYFFQLEPEFFIEENREKRFETFSKKMQQENLVSEVVQKMKNAQYRIASYITGEENVFLSIPSDQLVKVHEFLFKKLEHNLVSVLACSKIIADLLKLNCYDVEMQEKVFPKGQMRFFIEKQKILGTNFLYFFQQLIQLEQYMSLNSLTFTARAEVVFQQFLEGFEEIFPEEKEACLLESSSVDVDVENCSLFEIIAQSNDPVKDMLTRLKMERENSSDEEIEHKIETILNQQENGRTLLHAIAEKRPFMEQAFTLLEFLVEQGADMTVRDNNGDLPIDLLFKENNGENKKTSKPLPKEDNWKRRASMLLASRARWQEKAQDLEFNKNKVIGLIQEALHDNAKADLKDKNKPAVAVIGATGAGKSTFVNFIHGTNYKEKKEALVVANDVPEIATVGHSTVSETLFPQVVPCKEYNMLDMGGLFDTRGKEEEICIGVSTEFITKQMPTVQAVALLIQGSELESKRLTEIRRVLARLGSIMQENGKTNFLLIITHKTFSSKKEQEKYQKKVVKKLTTLQSELTRKKSRSQDDEAILYVLKEIIKDPSQLIALDVTDENNRDVIFDRLEKFKSCKMSELAFEKYSKEVEKFRGFIEKIQEYRKILVSDLHKAMEEFCISTKQSLEKITFEKSSNDQELSKFESAEWYPLVEDCSTKITKNEEDLQQLTHDLIEMLENIVPSNHLKEVGSLANLLAEYSVNKDFFSLADRLCEVLEIPFNLDNFMFFKENIALKSKNILKTKGYGNCFFHATFGESNGLQIECKTAMDYRKKWHEALSQYASLADKSMPEVFKDAISAVFLMFLEDPTVVPELEEDLLKNLCQQTHEIMEKTEENPKNVRASIYLGIENGEQETKQIFIQIIQELLNTEESGESGKTHEITIRNLKEYCKKNNLTSDQPEALWQARKALFDLIKGDCLKDAIFANQQTYFELYVPNYQQKDFDKSLAKDNFLANPELYQCYLHAIKSQGYYIFIPEIPMLASLFNVKIMLQQEKGDDLLFEPSLTLPSEFPKRTATISHAGVHYSKVKINSTESQQSSNQINIGKIKPINQENLKNISVEERNIYSSIIKNYLQNNKKIDPKVLELLKPVIEDAKNKEGLFKEIAKGQDLRDRKLIKCYLKNYASDQNNELPIEFFKAAAYIRDQLNQRSEKISINEEESSEQFSLIFSKNNKNAQKPLQKEEKEENEKDEVVEFN